MKPISLATCVKTGLRVLEDTSPLYRQRQWWQASGQETLHTRKTCARRWGAIAGNSLVRANLIEASTRKCCAMCVTANKLRIIDEVTGIVRIERDMRRTQRFLNTNQARYNPQPYEDMWRALEQADINLEENLLDYTKESFRKYLKTLNDNLCKQLHGHAVQQRSRTIQHAAAHMCQQTTGRTKNEYAGIVEVKEWKLFPNVSDVFKVSEAWCKQRPLGKTDAVQAAVGQIRRSKLTGRISGTARKHLLKNAMHVWEINYQHHVTLTKPQLVHIPNGLELEGDDPDINGLLIAYPYLRSENLAIVPEIVGMWIKDRCLERFGDEEMMREDKWEESFLAIPIKEGSNLETLTMVAELWEPYNEKSVYRKLADALAAVEAL